MHTTKEDGRLLSYVAWELIEKMPFLVVSPDTNVIVSEAFKAIFSQVTEEYNLKAKYNNGLLMSWISHEPKDTRWLMEMSQWDIIDFPMMSLCAVFELMMQQSSGGPGPLVTDAVNLIFVSRRGNFKPIRNSPHNYDTIVKYGYPIALVISWDLNREIWFVDVQSVGNPRLWDTGTVVHFINFDFGI